MSTHGPSKLWTDRAVVRVPPRDRKERPPAKAVSQDNRVHNRSLVLRTLYRTGAMSRSDLARASGLTRPTISALVAELEAEALIVELGPRDEPRVGKPATLLSIDDDATSVIALDLSHDDRLVGAVLNLRGTVVERAEVPVGAAVGSAAADLVLHLGGVLRDLAPHRILGVGIGTPGIVDDEGVVRYAAHLQWADLPLADLVSQGLGIPAYVGNDVNMAALGALHFRSPGVRDLIVVSIENGVGMGVVLDGRLVEGEHFAAGEIGHITVSEHGALCICGRRGCLQTFITAAHNTRSARRGGRADVLAEAGRALGVAVAPITTALNLSLVIVTGPRDLVTDDLIRAAIKATEARTLPIINNSVDIVAMAGDDDLTLQGAAALVLSGELGVL